MKTSASLLAAALCAIALSGCDEAIRQDMANQPKNRPESASDFFADGRSARPLVENTVARGSLDNDVYNVPKDFAGFPPAVKVNERLLRRGEDRYRIFCTPCHGLQGDGQGMIATRGMKHPPSYHIDRLRQAPNGYFYDVITNGFGAMYSYSERIPPADRWAIVAYVRALQLSRNAKAADLPPDLRQQLDHAATSGGIKE
ncbi:MAG TPA: cytochrome c [Candidatus Eisenbacteria bacterium]|jgi:mono/diheme cytochrome c family protein|nr:cytochrome c [Candidatus Eisenbacteria bacterium]